MNMRITIKAVASIMPKVKVLVVLVKLVAVT